jgi:hypothetical protein
MMLFNRTATLAIGGQDLKLRTVFEIEKEMSPQGGRLDVKIYNLSRDSQNALEVGNQKQYLELSAGYNGINKLIFSGPIYYAETRRDGADIITTCQAFPGATAAQTYARIAGASSCYEIYLAVVNALKPRGVVQGKISPAIIATLKGATFAAKHSDIDTTSGLMNKICRQTKLKWNTLDQQLNLYSDKEYQDQEMIQLDKKSGMLGLPSKTQEGNYKVTSLLNADLEPGKHVRVVSEEFPVHGDLYIIKATHRGDSYPLEPGAKWETEIEAANVGTQPGFVLGGS